MDNNEVAFLFPGQGSGSVQVGMGRDLIDSVGALAIFAEANRELDMSISSLCFRGPEEELLRTRHAQPACLMVGLAAASAFRESPEYQEPDFIAGHSVGLITAAAYAHVISQKDAWRIIKERSRLMEEACGRFRGERRGRMSVVLLPKHGIEEICRRFGGCVANYNSNTQIVLSGSHRNLANIEREIMEKRLARRIIPLGTEGAFHSEHMRTVPGPFIEFLDSISFSDPSVPIVANSTAKILTTGEEIRREMIDHICAPVLWHRSLEVLHENGVSQFVELGFGTVLTSNIERSSIKGMVGNAFLAVAVAALLTGAVHLRRRRRKKR